MTREVRKVQECKYVRRLTPQGSSRGITNNPGIVPPIDRIAIGPGFEETLGAQPGVDHVLRCLDRSKSGLRFSTSLQAARSLACGAAQKQQQSESGRH